MNSLENFASARDVLRKIVRKTPLIKSNQFSEMYGNEVYFKPENMQVTGAYKVRGAYYKISQMPQKERAKGLVTSSAGNHAQGVAYAAKLLGADAVIVMPTTTPLVKVNNTKKLGATVVLAGDNYDEAYAEASTLSEEKGFVFVHPFNDLEIATGQGTVAVEILEELPDADVLLVPIGGGGLAAGVSTYAKLFNPSIRVIGVEPKGAASMTAAMREGRIISLNTLDTIADGVAVKTPGDVVFPYIQKNIDEILLVDDAEIPDAYLDMTEYHKMVVENAGLITVAALRQLHARGKKIVSILSGGNMDVLTMAVMVHHGLINRGRVFTFSLMLPDRPGELANAMKVIGECKGNIVRVEHNQFVHINRNAAVALEVTLEAFGHEHKREILEGLMQEGYNPVVCTPNPVW